MNETKTAVKCMSFGFKYGIPQNAMMLFDVRCFPNPFYVDELREKNGLDKSVSDYVFECNEAREFLSKLCDVVELWLSVNNKNNSEELVVAIGCTGGQHRSVAFVEKLHKYLNDRGYNSSAEHRELDRVNN